MTWLETAKRTGLKKYDLLTSSFDVDFELGRYFNAANEFKALKSSGIMVIFSGVQKWII